MEIVGVNELPMQRFCQGLSNSGFAGASHTHQEDDHRSVGSHTR